MVGADLGAWDTGIFPLHLSDNESAAKRKENSFIGNKDFQVFSGTQDPKELKILPAPARLQVALLGDRSQVLCW